MDLSNNKISKPWEELEEEYQQSIVKTLPEDETIDLTKGYNKINWGNYFYLDETSPSGLRWKVNVMSGKNHKTISTPAGRGAGSYHHGKISGSGGSGWRVTLEQKHYMVHRVIYVMVNGTIDSSLVVDHLDGNPSNNSISNLALKSSKANSQNRRINVGSRSGTAGVSMDSVHKDGIVYNHWVARWTPDNGKRLAKSFSVNKYGYDNALELAINYRIEQMILLNKAGAGYTDRHIYGEQL